MPSLLQVLEKWRKGRGADLGQGIGAVPRAHQCLGRRGVFAAEQAGVPTLAAVHVTHRRGLELPARASGVKAAGHARHCAARAAANRLRVSLGRIQPSSDEGQRPTASSPVAINFIILAFIILIAIKQVNRPKSH